MTGEKGTRSVSLSNTLYVPDIVVGLMSALVGNQISILSMHGEAVLFDLLESNAVLRFIKQHKEGLFYMSNDRSTGGPLVVKPQSKLFKAIMARCISYTLHVNHVSEDSECYKPVKRTIERDLNSNIDKISFSTTQTSKEAINKMVDTWHLHLGRSTVL